MPSGASSLLSRLLNVIVTVFAVALGVVVAAAWIVLRATLWVVGVVASSVVR
ncbi:hypothetical protein [Paracraurococcus lichenis]|uniref:Uncharacterized protein n=1 Tax=Paracraurococcus lichenis TaxID=3064888 RepID=A0ABT9E9S8_9PROT|nr:hypothetical protein [Paracraurococcus sp. LOR1-02]MDO9712820.1 hypothetical protein [Paracraurococcus sp. LOR1-02]